MMTFLQIKQGLNKKVVQPLRMYRRRKKYRNNAFSIISMNCIGGGISHDFGWQFLSPTINLFMYPQDFLMFCENLDECLNLPVHLKEYGFSGKKYPIGEMETSKGPIELHFLHYESFEEAQSKWIQRSKRVNKDKIILLFSDQNGCTQKDVDQFDKLPYPKIFFAGNCKLKSQADYTVYVKPDKKELRESINPVDHCMLFSGLSGLRRYEKNFEIEKFFDRIIEGK